MSEKHFHARENAKFVRKIRRKCLICGKWMWVRLTKSGHYDKGHFFSKLKFPIEGTGEHVKVGTFRMGGKSHNVVRWTGKVRKVEYWECNKCFDEGVKEDEESSA
ncbi:MAG: hypothetical protein V1776_03175 [Candidatus Diapherotrites archaeon]